MNNGNLVERAEIEIRKHGNINRLSKAIGVNPGVIYRAKKGGNSPTLRRLWGVPKHPPVPRLIINGCPPELKARFEAMCNELDMTRLEMLVELMDFYEME